MSIIEAIILGIVEGITEFLPISSTGHLILVSELLGITQTEFVKSFEIAIQLGAILSVVVLYWRKFLLQKEVLFRVGAAFLPTALIGFALYSFIREYLIGNTMIVLWSLLTGGAILIAFELWHTLRQAQGIKNQIIDIKDITYSQAFAIGLAQAVAVIPGVSRSAATILGGLFLGISRQTIVEFSFLLAVPTMAAATGLDLIKNISLFSADEAGVLAVGFMTSFIGALLAIKFLLSFIKTHTFIPFGVYRILLALTFLIFLL